MVASGQRAVERCNVLGGGAFSDSPDFLYRPYLGSGYRATLDQVAAWMEQAGMTTRIDAAGNLIGRYGEAAKSLIIASHLDSVRDAGRYDGPLGVMLGIEVVAALNGRALPFAIEVYGFGDEEGSRFPAAMLTSRAVAGALEPAALEVPGLDDALQDFGLSRVGFLDARRDPADLVGYVEAHIEQGPVLEAEGLALGAVTAIAAQLRFEITVDGIAGHAGTNSMGLRRDALTAAAEMVLAVEDVARQGPDDLVATVGRMAVGPGAPNVVPGLVVFSLDVRAGTEDVRNAAADNIRQRLSGIAVERRIGLDVQQIHDLPAVPCDPMLMDLMDQAVVATGQTPRRLVSGAGHDAMVFSPITPTAMLFIRCKDGISHNPRESVTPEDADLALRALTTFIDLLEARYA
ncbi:N-carbamoyl-L-amino acid hydrolase [Asticcacaulis biprosthecium C19]|uniref:N-carbamoyl-L-amino acid hydrolase n=1 Tax=Asticcacaulis biprosthecium C19 TaxID=715226 RepID=F4QN30_9CAUL|nr:allantoate amidohydrolase [Asticcacaulis biprosthecium]EGF91621.1 N-carbamoyl-L-amino acid hydrolase [Asticcacaulis biprosthecium C19]